jgi:thioesterase domain-containing protein/acyl carrier protein
MQNPSSTTNIPLLTDIHYIIEKGIRENLLRRLPDYMVPSDLIALQYLPLTSNGKVDRLFLSQKEERKVLKKACYQEPSTQAEKALANIWMEILGINQVSIHDNFFEIGGNSIQAFRMFSKIKKAFGKNLPLGLLIKAPTIERLATMLSEADAVRWSSLVPIQPYGSRPPIFCVHGGWGHVLFYRNLADHLGPDQPLYGLQVKGLNGKDTPFYRMEDMAAHYLDEIRSVQPKGPYYLGGYCYGAIVAFEMAQQLIRKGEEVALLANFNGVSPITMFPENFTNNNDPIVCATAAVQHSSENVSNVFNKLSYHKNHLANLSIKEKLLYPFKRLKHKMKYWYFRAKPLLSKIVFKYYTTFGITMPEELLKLYIQNAMYKSQKNYLPEKYPGEMIVFRSPELFDDPHLGWSDLVAGSIKTFDIPGEHPNRTYIFYEPFVPYLAEELKKHLNKV